MLLPPKFLLPLSAAMFIAVVSHALEVEISHDESAGVEFMQTSADSLVVQWPADSDATIASATFSWVEGTLVIESLSIGSQIIASDLEPYFEMTIGKRNLDRNGWMVFFDKVNTRPYTRHAVSGTPSAVRAISSASRALVEFDGYAAETFRGRLAFTFYAGSPLLHVAAVMQTEADARAILYDGGLRAVKGGIRRYAWAAPTGGFVTRDAGAVPGLPVATKFRTILARFDGGTLAVFPPPHRFIYPLDFSDNFGFNFAGRNYDTDAPDRSFGVRQPPEGDRRFVPWVNAPPGTEQRLDFFVLLSDAEPEATLEQVKRYTHGDRFVPIDGYETFTSHFHVEHALDVLQEQKLEPDAKTLPKRLRAPGFVQALRETGVDIVHLAEFHNGATPKLDAAGRLKQLRMLHAECARLSDENFLLLPGEEPNVHLGGHWISVFPKPVYWVLNRPEGTPFAVTRSDGETLYHVGNPDDVLELMRREGGLMWTAHARIKSSIGFPDKYNDTDFYKSDRYFGAAWKAMPADYSRDTLGWRVLDLQDDMANWGGRKFTLGEVDVFRVEPDHELYGNMNINYVELDELPRFENGWQPLVDALSAGHFFVTTGEILITDFTINGARAGETVEDTAHKTITAAADLQWTFPPAFAVVISGDGNTTRRHRIGLKDQTEFGTMRLNESLPADGAMWSRLEVWDIAGNGAFTQPVWFEAGSW